jgi:peptidoglycan DL-endopeptidase CwlO
MDIRWWGFVSTYRIKPIHKLNHSAKRKSKILLAIIAALLALGVVISAMAMVSVFGILLPDKEEVTEIGGTGVSIGDIQISKIGEGQIPKEYIPIYKAAGEKYNIPWTLIAAIHRVETNFGQDLNTSSVGAIGHTQFMVKTWVDLTVQPLYPVMGIENLSNSVKLLTHKGEDNTERSLKGNV